MEKIISIENLMNHHKAIDPVDLFGKDTIALSRACMQVMKNCLYPYKDCYVSADKPSLADVLQIQRNDASIRTIREVYNSIVDEWYAKNPGEKQKETMSRKLWEEERDRQFRIIYGIAKRHHVRLEWCGNHSGCRQVDRWVIHQHGKRIGIINCG